MNGVCCGLLLDETDVIFGKIKALVADKLKCSGNKSVIETNQIDSVLNTFKSLFDCMDVVFSKLCIIDPIEEDIEEMKMAIHGLEKVWRELDLTITPKMHILTNHTIDQVIRFGGIADKVEDFVEKYHQTGKRLDHLVARMNSRCFRQQELVKIRRQWISNDPSVEKRIVMIRQNQKSRIESMSIPCLNSNKKQKTSIKHEKRELTMRQIIDNETCKR